MPALIFYIFTFCYLLKSEETLLKDKRYREVAGILFFLAGVILLLSLTSYNVNDYKAVTFNRSVENIIGPVGALISHLVRSAFGIASYIFVAMLLVLSFNYIKEEKDEELVDKLFTLFFLVVSLSALISATVSDVFQKSGGFIGYYIYQFLKSLLGLVGAYLVISVMNISGLILLGFVSIASLLKRKAVVGVFLGNLKGKASGFIQKRELPFNTIDEDLKSNGRVPWIVKKKVIIGEVKISEDYKGSEDLKLLMPKDDFINSSLQRDKAFEESSVQDYILLKEEMQDSSFKDFDNCEYNSFDGENSPEELCNDYDINKEEDLSCGDDSLQEEESLNTKWTIDEYEIRRNRILSIDALSIDEEVSDSLDNEQEDAADSQDDFDEETIVIEDRVFEQLKINKEYIIPTDFLHNSEAVDTETWESEIKRNSHLLVRTLADFGIESRVINVNRGPVVTLYEMQIAAGIKINRIVGLADDIAMALAAYRVRIVAPIPGKSAVGVELPNRKREMVTLGDIIKSRHYQEQRGSLKVALGKDILGVPVTIDLKNQPHLLIAGATGAGKSVCVNAIITSILYNYDPNYVRFILVDPKMVELQLYNGMPHLLTPVITEPHLVPAVLKWSIMEMERRYRLLASKNTRDIITYNEKINKGRDERLPFIVIIIDELADLMMVASKEIEGYITRIAQKARAVGIHLVLATQRPSVDVITGIIKANFPARIAFQVAQKTDSRTIIDQNGAEKLLGKGDMLYQSPLSSYPVRIQGAFISEGEIERVVSHLRTLGSPQYIDIESSVFADEYGEYSEEEDELFVEALKIVEDTKKASASYLQRRLSIGYNRAARMIEKMEELGYIGPQQGSKPREVFI
ncbi:MAG: DNA translocase SpoIIIE [Spirochaetes bacterium ADurb.Bin218]|jgi:S-DNA-T family DNA segregation ATPase FtsK/SpoIIIE|nr:MAG: DNA translocase SpoIIIE [Spirochaetes bacterium ADurb.Bin218]